MHIFLWISSPVQVSVQFCWQTTICLSSNAGLAVAGMTSINQCQCNSRRDHPDSMTPAELLVAEDIVSLLIWPSAPHHPLCVWAPIWPHLWPPMKCHLAKRRIDQLELLSVAGQWIVKIATRPKWSEPKTFDCREPKPIYGSTLLW